MSSRSLATITSKGQITVPVEVRRKWDLKAGDQIAFEISGDGGGRFIPKRRRSIFESIKTLPPMTLGRPLRQKDIDNAIAEGMQAKYGHMARKKK
jgi:AbrB family looped-hinge helix DNA binding protein